MTKEKTPGLTTPELPQNGWLAEAKSNPQVQVEGSGALANLGRYSAWELTEQSSIDPAVIAERRYRTVQWTANDRRGHDLLAGLGIPSWARDGERGSGLLIPMYRATGERIAAQWKPEKPPRNREGKVVKYASVKGQTNRLDVHPRNRDRIADPTVPLWITEGIKKADSLTSRGACVVALTGVFNWRSSFGSLGDWEDVPLKGREVVVCFDADAATNLNVLRAMVRLGRWLKSKGTRAVRYLIVPATVGEATVKGADDYLAAGGTLDGLLAAAGTAEPNTDTADGTFSDACMGDTIADDVLAGRYVWCKGLGWLAWNGQRWEEATDETVTEEVRQYVLDRFADVLAGMRTSAGQAGNTNAIDGWRGMLSLSRMRNALVLARGNAAIQRKAEQFDADPDLLNTPSGVVDLTTGKLGPHDPDLLITKITKGSYRPGYTHPDWTAALGALPPDKGAWFQIRIGQAITGHPTTDGIAVIMQGGGENGKSLLTTDGLLPALGDYASTASAKLITSMKGDRGEHSTEVADLRGKRFLVAEEMTENRALDVVTIKRIMDVGRITARYVHKDNMTFDASHSLFATSNYVPIVTETDHGSWRRLALLQFPYTFRKLEEEVIRPTDRLGDPELKARIKAGADGRHDAIVTWAVEGAARYAQQGAASLRLPPVVTAETLAWRITADRILGYWTERLIADPFTCVLTDELLADFNNWLTGNGHREWSRELFTPRFKSHSETSQHGVEERRKRDPQGLVRKAGSGLYGAPDAVPAQVRVWMGVRWRTDDDLQEDDSCAECAGSPETFSYPHVREEFPQARHTRHSSSSNGSSQDQQINSDQMVADFYR